MTARQRLVAVDMLRGLVMIVMALDHVRKYFAATPLEAEDMSDPGLALFLTRWITHFCAPVFVFLAGTSAWLYREHYSVDNTALRRFLVSRGAWLVVAEFLLINPFWPLWLDGYLLAQVIWAIGWSMIALGLLLPLGPRNILLLGLAITFGHNLLDGIDAHAFGRFAPLWLFLHDGGIAPLAPGWNIYLAYPVLPWIGVMLLGYAFGRLLTDGSDWRRGARYLGMGAILLFILLRVFSVYGNPAPFAVGDTLSQTLIALLNTEKYPPSLQYLLMTLGPALLLLPALERVTGRVAEWLTVFGRVPFFYYVLHFALIYLGAIAWSYLNFGEAFWWFRGEAAYPAGYEYSLLRAYVAWITVPVLLYPACRWYADFKRRRRDLWWLSYA